MAARSHSRQALEVNASVPSLSFMYSEMNPVIEPIVFNATEFTAAREFH
jgi:hypothetical protein